MFDASTIAPDVILRATQALVGSNEFAPRIAWWLRNAHSAERWLQFEWAYRFQGQLDDTVSVVCELGRVDVTVRRGAYPFSGALSGLELKWYGSWWVDDLAQVRADIEKVRASEFPAAALLFFLWVDPTDRTEWHDWIGSQTRRLGVPSIDNFTVLVEARLGLPSLTFEVELPDHPEIEGASLLCYSWYNRLARSPTS